MKEFDDMDKVVNDMMASIDKLLSSSTKAVKQAESMLDRYDTIRDYPREEVRIGKKYSSKKSVILLSLN